MQSAELHSQDLIHVLVGDNSRIDSHLLAEALRRDHGLQIVGCTSSSREFLEIATHTKLDVAIISASLDDDPRGGMATLRELHDIHPDFPAVLLLDSPKRELVLDAFRAGARGIFSKHESLETLCKCVRVVHEGQVWASSREVKFALDLLSRRELQVVHYLAEGLTNREIGVRLGLSRTPSRTTF
jgi:two-component system, NarL family, nitrate/nitrite response regulator NarL